MNPQLIWWLGPQRKVSGLHYSKITDQCLNYEARHSYLQGEHSRSKPQVVHFDLHVYTGMQRKANVDVAKSNMWA